MRNLLFLSQLSCFVACQDDAGKSATASATKSTQSNTDQGSESSKTCTYKISGTSPEWTAYKFTEKKGVGGTFDKFKVTGMDNATSVVDALNGLSIEIDSSSVNSKNPARDKTIATSYFAKFAPAGKINADIESVDGNEKKGTLKMKIDMNGVSKSLDFSYAVADGKLTAKSVMDMLDFKLQPAFDSIHKACEGQHTGSDGVSKTWTEVGLKVTAKVEKTCE